MADQPQAAFQPNLNVIIHAYTRTITLSSIVNIIEAANRLLVDQSTFTIQQICTFEKMYIK